MDAARVVRNAITTGIPFGAMMALVLGFQRGLRGVVAGAVSGVLFGVVIALFQETQRRKLEIKGTEFEGEPLLHQGPANHWLGRESRGGWLILTARRLIFRSHGKNFQNAPLSVAVAQIAGAQTKNTLGLIPNGLLVKLTDGHTEQFVVSDRAEWLARIEHARGAAVRPR